MDGSPDGTWCVHRTCDWRGNYLDKQGGHMKALSEKLSKELRSRLPYGVFISSDGRETLINRSYEPMFTRASVNDTQPQKCKPTLWVHDIVDEVFFFDDWCSPFYADNKKHRQSRKRCEDALEHFFSGKSIEPFIYTAPMRKKK